MGKKLDILFSEWVEKARRKPTEGHRATLANGAMLLYFPTSQRLEVWRDGEIPQKGQSTFGAWVLECATFERYATTAGITVSNRRMQVDQDRKRYCARWDAVLTMQRAV